MQVSVDQKIYAPLVLCFAVACALAFLLISTTAQAGHDNGDNQCISDVKVIDLGGENAQTFAVNGQSPTVGFQDHIIYYTKENEVILQVDTTPTATVKVPESDIGDGGSNNKGNWNSISDTTSLEVRIRDATREGSDITSINVDVHDTECSGGNQCDSSTCGWENQSCGDSAGEADCNDGEMLQQYNCTDDNCDDGNYQCVDHDTCSSSCISSGDEFSEPSCTSHSGDHDQCDDTLEKGWEDGVPAEGETGTWAREGCYSAGNEGDAGSCLSDGKVTNQRVRCDSNSDPTAADDGDNDASICNDGSPQNISVLDNDTDPDGDDLTVDSVEENPTDLGGTATVGGDGDYVQYTPPTGTTSTDTFDYTAKDTNDNTDTATVSVNVDAENCGDISVSFQDDNGNSVSVNNAFVNYNDDELSGSGNSFSYEVDLYDDGRDALIQPGYISPPEGYRVLEDNWVDKEEAETTYNQPNKSELGF